MTTELTDEQREQRRFRARDLIEARLTETWPAWRRPGRKPNLALAADIALDSLGDLAAEILVDGTMMRALTIRDGVATLELAEATEMVTILAAGMRGMLGSAENYVEAEMTDGKTGEGFTVTVRRRERPTPHEFRQQAEARADKLAAELEETRDALAVARRILGTTEQADTVAAPGPQDLSSDQLRAKVFEWQGSYLDEVKVRQARDAEVARQRAGRAAILRETADHAESLRQFDPSYGARKAAQISENVGVLRVADALRRLADEAQQPTPAPAEARTVETEWADGDPLMNAIAAAVLEQCEHSGDGIVIDHPRTIAAAAATVARRILGTGEQPETEAPADLTELPEDTARRFARRLVAVEQLCAGRPGDHTLTVEQLITAMSDADDESEAAR